MLFVCALLAACTHRYIDPPDSTWTPVPFAAEPAPDLVVAADVTAGYARGYRKVDGGWLGAQCLESRACRGWAAVPASEWPALDALLTAQSRSGSP